MGKSRRQVQILGTVFFLILVYSAEAFLLVKDAGLLEASIRAGLADSFDTYLSMHLVAYLLHILVPVLLAATVYFVPERRWNRIFRGIFTLLLLAAGCMRLLEWQTRSLFFYLSLIGYLLILIVLNRAPRPESEANV